MKTNTTKVAITQTAWLLTPSDTASSSANDASAGVQPERDSIFDRMLPCAVQQAARFGLCEEVVHAIFEYGATERGDFATRMHFLDRQRVVSIRKRFGKAWRDAWSSVVLVESMATGRIVAIEHNSRPRHSARVSRGQMLRQRMHA